MQRTLKKEKVQFLSGVKERNWKIRKNSTEKGYSIYVSEITI